MLQHYGIGTSGWTDELTSFHEDTAGANHPIDRASRRDAIGQLRRHIHENAPTILEVGCSSGFMLHEIRRHFPEAGVIGADYVRRPLDVLAAEMPEVPLLQFDLTQCPLPDQSIDAVVLLNVLEHIEDDAAAVRHSYPHPEAGRSGDRRGAGRSALVRRLRPHADAPSALPARRVSARCSARPASASPGSRTWASSCIRRSAP